MNSRSEHHHGRYWIGLTLVTWFSWGCGPMKPEDTAREQQSNTCQVVVAMANVRQLPDIDSALVGALTQGTAFSRLATSAAQYEGQPWYQLALTGGKMGWVWSGLVACGTAIPAAAPAPAPATSVSQFMGFHDCGSAGSPIIWAPGRPGDACDASFHQLMADLGGRGWVTVVGYVGGSFLEGYQVATQGRLDFNQIPQGTSVLLRLDSGASRAFPPVREAAEYDRYGNAVVTWLQSSPGADRVDFIQLGNEQDQYLAEYPPWEASWSAGMSDEALGLATCDFFGTTRKVQYMTPTRYAQLFVAVGLKLRAAGLPQRLVTSPPMPMRFAQHDASYRSPSPICIDSSVGDYLQAIADEARARGLTNPVGGIGLHLQGVGHEETAANTKLWLSWSLGDATTSTRVEPSGGSFVVRPAGSVNGFAHTPVFISEIHPPPPFWAGEATSIKSWVVNVARGIQEHNATSAQQVHAVTLYRYKPASDVPIDPNRQAVVDGLKEAVSSLGL